MATAAAPVAATAAGPTTALIFDLKDPGGIEAVGDVATTSSSEDAGELAVEQEKSVPPDAALDPDAFEGTGASTRGLTCTTCGVGSFASVTEQRHHFRSDWHRLNTRRALKGQPPLSEQAFDELDSGTGRAIRGSVPAAVV